MIVVVGLPLYRGEADRVGAGLAVEIALAARSAGAEVQLAGKVGDDPSGDAVLLELARSGVGHAAVLRDPAHPTPALAGAPHMDALLADDELDEGTEGLAAALEPADPAARPSLDVGDVELALSYLVDFRALVVADRLDAAAAAACADAARFAGARLVALVPEGEAVAAADTPALAEAIVLAAPPTDPDGDFAHVVGGFAAALDRLEEPGAAFRSAIAAAGWETVAGG